MAKMKVMTPRQTLRIILLPLVAPLPRPALPPLALLASDDSDTLLELRGKEKEPTCGCGGGTRPTTDPWLACPERRAIDQQLKPLAPPVSQ